ncbi:Map microtubule affinity-regulating kinase [Boothiomyces sp. JEL0866]|nr:Map microtubule affinity-regulating kinase [Boothiomyces sp. JEL0866]
MTEKDCCLKDFKIGKLLGEGAFSKVKLATHQATGFKLAVKIIDKSTALAPRVKEKINENSNSEQDGTVSSIASLENEVKLLLRLDHPNIVKIYQVIDGQKECHVIMQYAVGGEMVEYLADKGCLSDAESQKYFRQLVSGLDHMHLANVVHRDLKLENLLLDANRNLLISDFGLGRTFESTKLHLLETYCGTPNYAAVELICGIPYVGVKADIWSAGVVLYFFQTGQPPFVGATISKLYEQVKALSYPILPKFTPTFIHLLQRIFVKDPAERISMDDLRNDAWVTSEGKLPPVPRITPKFSGTDDWNLTKNVSGIKNTEDSNFIVYNFHAIPSSTLALDPIKIDRRKSVSVVRRKTISVKGQQPNMEDILAAGACRPSASDISKDSPNLDDSKKSSFIDTKKPSFSETKKPSFVDSKRSSFVIGAGVVTIAQAPEINIVVDTVESKINFPSSNNALGESKREDSFSATPRTPLRKRAQTIAPSTLAQSIKVEPMETPVSIKRNNTMLERKSKDHLNVNVGDGRNSFLGVGRSFSDDQPSSPVVGTSARPSIVAHRMSTVSPVPLVEGSPETIEPNMDEITKWHEIHRPPAKIRTIKFGFRPNTTSSMEPANMFQDIHKALLSISNSEIINFKRTPDIYQFVCEAKEGNDVEFDVEICKVWLLSLHAVRFRRIRGDGMRFKKITDNIIDHLDWKNQ